MKLEKPVVFETTNDLLKDLEVVYGIIDISEEMLKEKGIYIPDQDRTGDEEEACIFGQTYYEIEEKLKEFLIRRRMLWHLKSYQKWLRMM